MRKCRYVVASGILGLAGSLLQIPVAIYLLCKSKRMMPSAMVLDISMYADMVRTSPDTHAKFVNLFHLQFSTRYVLLRCMHDLCARAQVISLVLTSGVGAGFGATNDVLRYVHGVIWEHPEVEKILVDYYNRAIVAVVLLLVGMLLSICATFVSARLRAKAMNDPEGV